MGYNPQKLLHMNNSLLHYWKRGIIPKPGQVKIELLSFFSALLQFDRNPFITIFLNLNLMCLQYLPIPHFLGLFMVKSFKSCQNLMVTHYFIPQILLPCHWRKHDWFDRFLVWCICQLLLITFTSFAYRWVEYCSLSIRPRIPLSAILSYLKIRYTFGYFLYSRFPIILSFSYSPTLAYFSPPRNNGKSSHLSKWILVYYLSIWTSYFCVLDSRTRRILSAVSKKTVVYLIFLVCWCIRQKKKKDILHLKEDTPLLNLGTGAQ